MKRCFDLHEEITHRAMKGFSMSVGFTHL